MIDTDKYEGHTPAPWKLDDRIKEMFLGLEADVELMQDAPLLLAEVKRLRESDGQWETHWLFIRDWLEEQMSVDNTVSTKHTIPIYATVWRVMEALRPRGEEE